MRRRRWRRNCRWVEGERQKAFSSAWNDITWWRLEVPKSLVFFSWVPKSLVTEKIMLGRRSVHVLMGFWTQDSREV
jgi:hypothetical protein